MEADMTVEQAREQMTLWVGHRDAARAKRDHYARLADGYQRMVDGLELIHPELTPTSVATDVETTDDAATEDAADDETPPDDVSDSTESRVNGINVSLAVLKAQPGVWLTADQLAVAMRERGWVSESKKPGSSVRYALQTHRKAGRVEETQLDGRTKAWRVTDASNTDAPVSAGASGPATTSGQGGEDHHAQVPLSSDHDHDLARRNGHRVDPSVAP